MSSAPPHQNLLSLYHPFHAQATAELSPADIAAMSNILFAVAPSCSEAFDVADVSGQSAHVRTGTIEECHSAMRQLLSVIHSLQQERDALRSAAGGADVVRLLELEKEVSWVCFHRQCPPFCFCQGAKN